MSVVSAKAQTQYRAHIPFAFIIDQKSYEAGDYSVDVLNTDSANKPLAIRDMKGRNSHLIMTTPGEDYSRVQVAVLVFDRYETEYSLSAIRTPSFAVKLPKSKVRETLGLNQNVQQKVVALSRK